MLNPVTVCLQGTTVDYSIVYSVIHGMRNELRSLRNDESWSNVCCEIDTFIEKHDLTFTAPRNKRSRKRKRFIDEMAVDDVITEPLKKI